jgi:hypothetical protein
MQTIRAIARGLTVLFNLSRDRFLGIAAVMVALLVGGWFGMPGPR